jgi:hypothetical protein
VDGNHDLDSTGVSANLLADNSAPLFSGNLSGGDTLSFFNDFCFPQNGPRDSTSDSGEWQDLSRISKSSCASIAFGSSTARTAAFYRLSFGVNHSVTSEAFQFSQIGSEKGFLEVSAKLTTLILGLGDRADLMRISAA